MTWLSHPAEIKTLAYMAFVTTIAAMHWTIGAFNPWLFGLSLLLSFAISAMHHNHSHFPIWRSRGLNLISDLWFTVFQGHPGYVFQAMHMDNHHRFHNGPNDLTRTDRFGRGNSWMGLLLHPIQFAIVAMPVIGARMLVTFRNDRSVFLKIAMHYAILFGIDGMALWLDWRAAFYVLIVPQLSALFWLLASNYLQHAHAMGESEFNHSRNFVGLLNRLFFNVGYHTAHHHQPDAHWSELPVIHRKIERHISPDLNEPSFVWYLIRVLILGSIFKRFQSQPLESKTNLEPSREP